MLILGLTSYTESPWSTTLLAVAAALWVIYVVGLLLFWPTRKDFGPDSPFWNRFLVSLSVLFVLTLSIAIVQHIDDKNGQNYIKQYKLDTTATNP